MACDTLSLTLILIAPGTDLELFPSVLMHAANPGGHPISSSQQADFSVVAMMDGEALSEILLRHKLQYLMVATFV